MDKLFIALQYILPHHLLSAVMHAITRVEWPPLKNYIIRRVVDLYKVDMQDAVESKIESYSSFNAFFTRALKPESRPLAEGHAIACPVDGEISQLGDIKNGRIFQAKKHDYSLLELIGGDHRLAQEFHNGRFATIYLSPRDYHRIHMPGNGRLRRMIHVPGRLFSVNRLTTSEVPRLFARNERLVCIFDSDKGPFAVILVGAIFVSSMETVWSGIVTPKRHSPTITSYQQQAAIELERGEEMGRFNMGSTVILLYPENTVEWQEKFSSGSIVKMGEEMGAFMDEMPGLEESSDDGED